MYDHFMFDIVNFVCPWLRILIYFILILVILFRVTGIIRFGPNSFYIEGKHRPLLSCDCELVFL